MFFVLSKTIAIVLLPSNLLLLLALAGLLLTLTRFRRAGFRLTAGALIVLAAASFLPVGNVLIHSLEQRFPPWDASRGAPDGIVVLGGDIDVALSGERGTPSISDANRILALARLAHEFPQARIVYSGGNPALIPDGYTEAEFLAPLLDQLGVPFHRVTLETRARNTAENAAFSKQLAQPKPGERWLLVTSAYHMPRAVGCFRHAGFSVEAYPVGWSTGRTVSLMPSLGVSGRLTRLDVGLHEWMGLIAYRVSGRTGELLPGV